MEPNPYESPRHGGQKWPERKSERFLVPIPKIDLPPALQVALMTLYFGGIALLVWEIIRSLR